MKFSYPLLKQYVPALPSKKNLVEALNAHSFETEDASGNAFEVSIPSNRYADAASHIGIAREACAVLGLAGGSVPKLAFGKAGSAKKSGGVRVSVKEASLCPRYIARECTDVRVGPSPAWMRTVLADCGLRSVNNVVDATNYVMLETGQPLHAFDADAIEGALVVRTAKRGERITTIEGKTYELTPDTLLIADLKGPLALAGVKGGERAAVSERTKRIVLEAANFDSVSVYRTSKLLGLATDASLRFSHAISPLLAEAGMRRVSDILSDIGAARPGALTDTAPGRPRERTVAFSIERFRRLTGIPLGTGEALRILKRLGFSAKGNKVSIPPLRSDVETEADLAEEIARLVGYDAVPSEAPLIRVGEHSVDEHLTLIDFVRDTLVRFGFDEVYSDSFMNRGDVEVANPIAKDKAYLRAELTPFLVKNVSDNLRFCETVKLFEIGKVFPESGERYALGIGGGSKTRETFFAVKGAVEGLLKALGFTDYVMDELAGGREGVSVKAGGETLGSVVREQRRSYAELDMGKLLDITLWEREYQPLPKYPAVLRDLSLSLAADAKIGSVMEAVELSDTKLIEDVDLVDEYTNERGVRQGITLRIVFRAADRTLSSDEVDDTIRRIASLLKQKFSAEVR